MSYDDHQSERPRQPLVRLAPEGVTFAAEAAITVHGVDKPVSLLWVWRHKSVKQVRALERRIKDEGLTDLQVLLEVLVGWGLDPHAEEPDEEDGPTPWRGPTLPDGQPAVFTPAALEQLLDGYPAAGPELWYGYLRALNASRLGN